jgi:DNA-binding GntR family transcriptional regulator
MADHQSHRDRTLAEAAATALHQMILSGQLKGGSPLRLQELAAALDMSVMPVREAIRRLAALGLIEYVPHRGATVRRSSVEDFLDTHRVRLMLELPAVEEAARRFTEEDREVAEGFLVDHMDLTRQGDSQGARDAHRLFHFALVKASGSIWLPRALEPVWQSSERYRFASPPGEQEIQEVDQEHRQILDACVRHEPEEAVAALSAHLGRAFGRMLSRLKDRVAREAAEEAQAGEQSHEPDGEAPDGIGA